MTMFWLQFLYFSSMTLVVMLVSQLCPTLLDPIDPRGPHQAPLSMEFSRQ